MRVAEVLDRYADQPVVTADVVDVWSSPHAAGDPEELVTQALRGEPVVVLGHRGEWAEVRLPLQPYGADERGYPGWLPQSALGPGTAGPPGWDGLALGDLVDTASQWLGLAYLWGGLSPAGLDCSGLVHLSARALGLVVPRDARDQAAGLPRSPGDTRGDLLFFWTAERDRIRHVTLVLDAERMLHAPHSGRSIEVIERSTMPYDRDFAWAARVPPR